MRRIAATALSLLALTVPALAEAGVGVTAAVNQSANGTIGGNVRTISLGDSVVFNERIRTDGEGLVQILLADGTTFMVGPNSDLVIDSFVYDPDAGTAQVTASFTRGVLRFIGGQTSKTPNGVTIDTPVGTMGIRGAMVDVVLDPPAGTPPHVDMLFGNEVKLQQGRQLLGRLYTAGYSLALGEDGVFDVLKTPPGWGSQIQAALAGRIGTTGGAPKGPSDGDVQNSTVAGNNSGNGVAGNTGSDGLTDEERDALLYAAAHYDELRNFILNNQHPYGLVGGVLSVEAGSQYASLPMQNAFDMNGEGGPNPVFASFGFNADNQAVAVAAKLGYLGDTCAWLGGCFIYEGGRNGGRLTFEPADPQAGPVSVDVDGYLLDHDDPALDPGLRVQLDNELNCQDCEQFIRWGFWGFSAAGVTAGSVTGDLEFRSAWVNGDLTTRAQLETLANAGSTATASYTGDAVGLVSNHGQSYTATGDLSLGWNFASRTGTIDISNFDGRDIGGTVVSFTDQTGFGGVLSGSGSFGIAQGAFVNNGNDTAAGVIGNFGFQAGTDYTASGVFMGERTLLPD